MEMNRVCVRSWIQEWPRTGRPVARIVDRALPFSVPPMKRGRNSSSLRPQDGVLAQECAVGLGVSDRTFPAPGEKVRKFQLPNAWDRPLLGHHADSQHA